eukprot:SAG11_NODE_858_length_6850_cov_11.886535_2_plen_295_part_00
MLRYQMQQEAAAIALAEGASASTTTVVMCDRGAAEGRIFRDAGRGGPEWAQVLRSNRVSAAKLLDRYDVVIDLDTVANLGDGSLYEYGLGSANPHRWHGPNQARDIAPLFEALYGEHPSYHKISCCESFHDKLVLVGEAVVSHLPDGSRAGYLEAFRAYMGRRAQAAASSAPPSAAPQAPPQHAPGPAPTAVASRGSPSPSRSSGHMSAASSPTSASPAPVSSSPSSAPVQSPRSAVRPLAGVGSRNLTFRILLSGSYFLQPDSCQNTFLSLLSLMASYVHITPATCRPAVQLS